MLFPRSGTFTEVLLGAVHSATKRSSGLTESSSFQQPIPELTLIENLLLKQASGTPFWHLGPTERSLMFHHCQMSQPLPEAPSSPLLHHTPHMTTSKASRMCLLAQSCASLFSIAKRITILGRNGLAPESIQDDEAVRHLTEPGGGSSRFVAALDDGCKYGMNSPSLCDSDA